MDPLIDRLRSQATGMDAAGLTPGSGLPSVVKRGKRYVAATAAATLMGATAAFAAGAVVVPGIIERNSIQTPTVVSTPSEETGKTIPTEAPIEDSDLLPELDDKPSDPPAAEPTEGPQEAAEDVGSEKDGADEAADTTGPALVVLSPAEGATVDSKTVTFSGEVDPGSTVKVGKYAATVEGDGSWSLVLIASKGLNTVTFTATDAAGNATIVVHKLTYVPAVTDEPKPDDKKPDDKKPDEKDPVTDIAELTANQQKAELTEAPFRNVYWGTASPEAKIAVISEYGTDYAWADGNGDWELAVTFTPPSGTKTFGVTVKLYEAPNTKQSFTLTTVNDAAPQPFTANQQSSKLTSEPYTNVYWGTTTPGTKIKVLSDYGWDYVYADGNGDWELAVTFTPPAGTKTFQVTARHYHDASVNQTFSLTTVAEESDPFTAELQHDSVAASNPVNTYSGTGEPGHEVWIWTESHGQTFTTIDQDGHWSVTFTYENVSAGDTFDTKARDNTSGTAHYFTVTVTDG